MGYLTLGKGEEKFQVTLVKANARSFSFEESLGDKQRYGNFRIKGKEEGLHTWVYVGGGRGLSGGNLDECYEEATEATRGGEKRWCTKRRATVARVEGDGRERGRSLETALGHKSRTKLSPGPAGRCNFKAR